MKGFRQRDHALGPGATHGEHHVVAGEVELLECRRVEREKRLVAAGGERQALHKGGMHLHLPERGRYERRLVHGRIDGRRGKDLVEHFEDALGAAHLVEVVVDDGDAGAGQRVLAPAATRRRAGDGAAVR